jgi:hypothetical protein
MAKCASQELIPFQVGVEDGKDPPLDGQRGSSRSPLGCALSPGPSTAISSQFYGCFLSRGKNAGSGRFVPCSSRSFELSVARTKVPSHFASSWQLPLLKDPFC